MSGFLAVTLSPYKFIKKIVCMPVSTGALRIWLSLRPSVIHACPLNIPNFKTTEDLATVSLKSRSRGEALAYVDKLRPHNIPVGVFIAASVLPHPYPATRMSKFSEEREDYYIFNGMQIFRIPFSSLLYRASVNSVTY
jgi:hypothetical protein